MVNKPTLMIAGIFVFLFGMLVITTYIDTTINPVTKEYQNITVGERFPGGMTGDIVSTDNNHYKVVDRNLFWKIVPNHKYRIELSYNWSPMDRMDGTTATLTNATEIFE